MKKFFSVLLAAVLLCMLCVPACAARVSADTAISTLETLGLMKGTDAGMEPERGATRAEALVMLLRLLGREDEALTSGLSSPFTDGGWADCYIGYAAREGLVKGVSPTCFGSRSAVGARDYLTMVLRALGYSDAAGDFTWQGSIAFADSVGLTHGEYTAADTLLREDLALISYTALTLRLSGSERTLVEQLYLDGAVSAAALKSTRLASAVNAGRREYSAAEIYELTSSAVAFVEVYKTDEALEKGRPSATGSGFFITGDGVLALTYHELEGCRYARVTTTDGRRFDVTGVLHYDAERDIAAVRVSRTDSSGEAVRFFPYLDVGDPAASGSGDAVYTVSNPLGLTDTVTAGLISNPCREDSDPAYFCLQFTAPIASGSSGGPLLNAYGEVIGINYATYTQGQNLNLAIPADCLDSIDLTGSGVPLSEVCETEDAKKAAAVITVPQTEIELHVGEETEILVTNTCPGQASVQYMIENTAVVSAAWGEFQTRKTVPLTIKGESVGISDVTITFAAGYGNEEAKTVLHVTVYR